MTTVDWVQDANSNFEVSSPEHLKQIMHKGLLYIDSGTPPTDYWAAGTNYIQTADIDLSSDSTDIKPIGVDGDIFYGDYDGGQFRISNWSYVDPNFFTSNECESYVGLFGYCSTNALKNIRLDGEWKLQGYQKCAGFLVGTIRGSDGLYGVWNIVCDFSNGTFVDTNSGIDTIAALGAVAGWTICPYVSCITLKGSVDFLSTTHIGYNGGVIGRLFFNAASSLIVNYATFPSGINGTRVGGIGGELRHSSSFGDGKYYLNAMTGDINGTEYAGGILGYYQQSYGNNITGAVNSMIGNITNTSDAGTGGIIGNVNKQRYSLDVLLNYVTGNISTSATNTLQRVGGLIGRWDNVSSSVALRDSVNAMNGDSYYSVIGDLTSDVNATIDTSFGLTYSKLNGGSNSQITVGTWLYSADLPELPYIALQGLSPENIDYEIDFVFGNLSGNSSYNSHTHAVLHKGDIQGPLRVDFDIPENNTTLYTTFLNVPAEVVVQNNGVTINSIGIPQPLAITARSINIPLIIQEVPGATGYNITYEGPTGGEITAVSGTTTLEHNITGLEPETTYAIKLYADTGAGYALTEELSATTLPNLAENYDITDFQDSSGVTDLTTLDAVTLATMASVLPEIASTGDVVTVAVSTDQVLPTSFVAEGDTLSIADIDGILLPFDQSSGAGQTASLTLSDGTTAPVTYDEVANAVTVDSVAHTSGDSFYLDGNKLQVFDFYGLTAVSVAVAPLLVEPLSINIPVVITEVPGAIGYKITYEGPNGVETTASSGVTTLEQNITGLVADTEYIVRLYADTGAGYVRTEELTAKTLTNIATNYDVTHLVQDGVINLSPLPESTIGNITDVMNELFATGDTVQVSVPGNAKLSTSFINLGDTLSIDERDGVLLPFVQSSGAGQSVGVTLSDGSTTVAIDYDHALNSVTVNGVVYYPGDRFILDGQKAIVAEY